MASAPRALLRFEVLEDRRTPALTIDFDYRFDSAGFFADPARKAILEQAGHDLASRIASTPEAIAPVGSNSWTATFFNPATGLQTSIPNLQVAEGTIVVFVGGRDLVNTEAGVGGSGGYSVGGSAAWMQNVSTRGLTGYSIWGGSIAFDTTQSWYAGTDAKNLTTNVTDLYTVATHELGHVLGFGTSTAFSRFINGQNFTGPITVAVNGGTAPRLSADLAHFANGTRSDSMPVSMEPYLQMGLRYGFTSLDYAALADIGWSITPPLTASPPPSAVSSISPPSVPPTAASNIKLSSDPFTLSGTTDGLVSTYQFQTTAEQILTKDPIQPLLGSSRGAIARVLVQVGVAFKPFADFNGVIRSAMADVNGDGVLDTAYVTGIGGPSRLRVIDGQTGLDLLPPTAVFGVDFTGGLFVASADFNGDGQADVIVSPDAGGGGRVSIFSFAGGVNRIGDFFGIEDVNFRGGARVAAADINGDGTPDLVVGAGTGGGPRVALFDGTTITQAEPKKLVGDFFAFPGDPANMLRNGVYVAAGDLNGDGKADLIFGAGPGGGPRVFVLDAAKVLSGDFDAARSAPLANFFAYDSSDRRGVQVAVKDVDGDGRLDLLAGSGTSQAITLYSGAAAAWTGGDPGNGAAFTPTNLAGNLEGVYVG
jgi:hypothetical protein